MSCPSRNGEFADSGQQGRQDRAHVVADRDRAVSAADPDVHVHAPGVVAPGDVAEIAFQPPVVRRVDDPLVEIVGPRVGPQRRQRDSHALREREEAGAALLLVADRLREALAAPGADLDLGVDQLSRRRLGEQVILEAALVDLLEAVLELEGVGVRQRELLLEPDREVLRGLEHLARPRHVEGRHPGCSIQVR